ncbi:hypothetical protein Tco_1497569, partial [Tanacetum coccineum]
VAQGPERQQVVTDDAPEVAEGAAHTEEDGSPCGQLERRGRRRIDDASTSAPQQPDP